MCLKLWKTLPPLLKAIVWEHCQVFSSSAFSFCKAKGHCYWKCKFYRPCVWNPAFEWLQIGHKSEKDNGVSICRQDVIVIKGLTWNPDIGNTLVWVLPNIWKLAWVNDTKFCRNITNKMLLNTTKSKVYSFYRFWVIKGKPTGGKIIPYLLRLGLK